ncbi:MULTISPECIES: LysR family transcriptional regulator [unclassified Bradyrhizobium]|uniref:LysR family transcriptional regulator n=1 Tax=unclassified Bradyrhizobium TaxID=2631580 RepID=UPI002449303F|nr:MULTISPECIES: LysR family transcriptional regulator [unclassified Bradyrhizobium]MDH2348510.1 LysR family transcriptional regulator [Bradyrhizobium sp. SSUT77]MDH2357016.1 LysR family transcriptional regulator [Bradyrhizobium sp. SSUT112]
MFGSHLPFGALHAFEASARHLSFTRAGLELRVTQAAVSHQVKSLEEILGVKLFRRLPRGLALTDEGLALVPVLTETFGRIRATLDQFANGQFREVVTVGAVGTFATRWLLPRLPSFYNAHPKVDLRVLTNNNRVDIAGEGLDFAVRFGDGTWQATFAIELMSAPQSPLCAPEIATRLLQPEDLYREVLLRSYRIDEWERWFAAIGRDCPRARGIVFDSSVSIAEAAAYGAGVALLPLPMFTRELDKGTLVRPFEYEIVLGSYWLTRLKSRRPTSAMLAFQEWLMANVACQDTRAAMPTTAL